MKRTVKFERFFVILEVFEHEEEFAETLDESRDEFESSEMFKIDESDSRWLLSEWLVKSSNASSFATMLRNKYKPEDEKQIQPVCNGGDKILVLGVDICRSSYLQNFLFHR